jgi:hypothetical protein
METWSYGAVYSWTRGLVDSWIPLSCEPRAQWVLGSATRSYGLTTQRHQIYLAFVKKEIPT